MLAQELHRCGSFWSLLLSIDRDPAECARRQGCRCGGRLHCANYPRAPLGGPEQLPDEYRQRFSFCCERDGCRKRLTPPSVRFLVRKVYLGAVVVLIRAMRQGPTPRPAHELSRVFGVDRADHRSMADLLARSLSTDAVLEDRTGTSAAGCRDCQPAVLAGGWLP